MCMTMWQNFPWLCLVIWYMIIWLYDWGEYATLDCCWGLCLLVSILPGNICWLPSCPEAAILSHLEIQSRSVKSYVWPVWWWWQRGCNELEDTCVRVTRGHHHFMIRCSSLLLLLLVGFFCCCLGFLLFSFVLLLFFWGGGFLFGWFWFCFFLLLFEYIPCRSGRWLKRSQATPNCFWYSWNIFHSQKLVPSLQVTNTKCSLKCWLEAIKRWLDLRT